MTIQTETIKLVSKTGKVFEEHTTPDGRFKYWQEVETPRFTEHLTEDKRFTYLKVVQQ
ncbi:MAG: hypothetical protein PHG08_00930 [Bacilli bacterium]|nr:hypothetical protein [Bacilli bacterium]